MRTTITALAIALTMTAAAQPRILLEAMGEKFTNDILDKGKWYKAKDGAYALMFGLSSMGVKAAQDKEAEIMSRLQASYVGRRKSEEFMPPYVNGLSDYYGLSMALKNDEAQVVHVDVYAMDADTILFALIMDKDGANLYCLQP